jgi:phosphatidylserine decarboxylase
MGKILAATPGAAPDHAEASAPSMRPPIVQRLVALIDSNGWRARFDEAICGVARSGVASLAAIDTLDAYLRWLDDLVEWAPRESGDSQLVHDKLVEFHFFVEQPALRELQSASEPGADGAELTELSQWIADFAKAWGSFLDTPASASRVETFRTDPLFRWDDYMPPPSGYLTFNQFFARHVKPGRRPVADLDDASVVVAPADANYVGQWRVGADSTIFARDETVSLKGMRWSLAQLLAGSPHAEAFAGGVVTHSALRTFDYHRFHAPLAGEVLESRIIHGQAWLGVDVVEKQGPDGRAVISLEAQEGTGYQFAQARGLVVMRTPSGLVACLPVGMAQVSSVVLTAEVGAKLRKGEELGYFQFGGSDFVMVFSAACGVELDSEAERHRMQGERAGVCRH